MVAGDVENGIHIRQLSETCIEDVVEEKEAERRSPPADFDDALMATGFGLYNIAVTLAAVPVAWASAFDITTMAFILISAECDFELTFIRKSLLVTSPYIGMIISSLFWGFIENRMNRRLLIILGLLIDALCNISCCIVESYYVLILLKIITGTVVSGPFTLIIPYITEFQPSHHLQKFTRWSGLLFNAGLIIPAILAFNITPQSWSISLFEREYSAWRIYLMVCTLPSIIGLITASGLPESPKYLMDIGKTTRALNQLRRIYVINNFKSPDTYPVKSLQTTKNQTHPIPKRTIVRIKDTWSDIKQLFSRKFLGSFILINTLQFGSLLGFNVMRLWVPHMFMTIANFDHDAWDLSLGNPTMCDYLAVAKIPEGPSNNTLYDGNCARWTVYPIIYVRSTIIAFSTVSISFLFALFYINRQRKKGSLIFCYVIAAVSSFAANWIQLVPIMLTLSSAIIVTGRITANIVIAINASVIPLPLRATALGFINNIGNIATIIGNLIFAKLVQFECVSSYAGIGCVFTVCLVLSFFTLNPPAEENKEIKA